jgi:hypothetical protein
MASGKCFRAEVASVNACSSFAELRTDDRFDYALETYITTG